MQANDRYETETADRKNALEAYIYSLRDSLMGKFEPFVKTELRDTFVSELDNLTDWLYEEGTFNAYDHFNYYVLRYVLKFLYFYVTPRHKLKQPGC